MPEIRISEHPICDFCSEPHWARRFHCEDFTMDVADASMPEMRSKGDWLACSVCASMIDHENWTGLLLRALEKHSGKYQMPRRILADIIKRSHDLFRAHYRKAESNEQSREI